MSRPTRRPDGLPETATDTIFFDGRERGDRRPFDEDSAEFLDSTDPRAEPFVFMARQRGETIDW